MVTKIILFFAMGMLGWSAVQAERVPIGGNVYLDFPEGALIDSTSMEDVRWVQRHDGEMFYQSIVVQPYTLPQGISADSEMQLFEFYRGYLLRKSKEDGWIVDGFEETLILGRKGMRMNAAKILDGKEYKVVQHVIWIPGMLLELYVDFPMAYASGNELASRFFASAQVIVPPVKQKAPASKEMEEIPFWYFLAGGTVVLLIIGLALYVKRRKS